jgi:hypothetical protein
MKGQWIGRYSGTFQGEIVVNVDECIDHFQGLAYLIDDNPGAPRIAVRFRTPSTNSQFSVRATEICQRGRIHGSNLRTM